MNPTNAIAIISSSYEKKSIPKLNPGDIVRVHQKVKESGKERLQIFEGIVIKISNGQSISGSFTLRKIASGVGVEKTYPLHSPLIAKIERIKSSRVRRAKLYYLRSKIGKKGKLKNKASERKTWDENEVVENIDKSSRADEPKEISKQEKPPIKSPKKTPKSPTLKTTKQEKEKSK